MNDIIGICVLIAKHHRNIPDFEPEDESGTGVKILSEVENKELFAFLDGSDMPITKYVKRFLDIDDFSSLLNDKRVQKCYLDRFVFKEEQNVKPLDFFLDYQFAFASLIQADKADAANLGNFIEYQENDVEIFCKTLKSRLDNYLSLLKQDSELNRLRTAMRMESIEHLSKTVSNHRVFELTAPTGSGKTLMLLSLASEIIKDRGTKRIIYVLPFLSITEQVEAEILSIFKGQEEYIQRVDSKSENNRFEKLQDELDGEPSEDKVNELNILEFQEQTFAYPFVITTFVRFFETLLSNQNAELLKLPNFSNCIFLLDEIQSLPPRMYGFLVGYITKFCEKFNSYAIISTATQPNFSLPQNDTNIKSFFSDYKEPEPLLQLKYFNNNVFNRYQIDFDRSIIDLIKLKNKMLNENSSILVILNTIDDTKELYNLLCEDLNNDEVILLNTHFTSRDRKLKIYLAKRRLREGKRIIVISTQLIEAGVDIDFPVLYRDFATVPSIVQSAGRCNRNGKLKKLGIVRLFNLKNHVNLIYKGIDRDLLYFTNKSLMHDTYQEKQLLSVQCDFFSNILAQFHFGKYWKAGNNDLRNPDFDFIKDIRQCMYDKIGKFQLIDKQDFGEEYQYFVPRRNTDKRFEILLNKHNELIDLLKHKENISMIRRKKKEIEIQIKRMANDIVQIHLKKDQQQPLPSNEKSYYGLIEIDRSFYSFQEGIDLKGGDCII